MDPIGDYIYMQEQGEDPVVGKYGMVCMYLGKRIVSGPWKISTTILPYRLLGAHSVSSC